jgi:hypothetical protein
VRGVGSSNLPVPTNLLFNWKTFDIGKVCCCRPTKHPKAICAVAQPNMRLICGKLRDEM